MATGLLSQALTLTLNSPSTSHLVQFSKLQFFYLSPFHPSFPLLSHQSKPYLRPIHSTSSDRLNPNSPPPRPPLRDEARDALATLLQEFGASDADSIFIASNSPKYVEMIVESVSELDELGLWESWSNGEIETNDLDFRNKVYCMAKRKGDKGILPFLESIGVKLSSAKVIASYLLSENLPELIDKVQFFRELLYLSGEYKELTRKNAKRMMDHLSIPPDEEIQRTLSFFQKMEARHGGLDMLHNGNISFPFLVESFPSLLVLSKENHLRPLVEYLELLGVPMQKIASILLSFPPIIFYDIEKGLKPRIHTLEKVWERKDVSRMLVKYPWIISARIQGNYAVILAFFYREKIPKKAVAVAIKSWPHIMGCSTRRMKLIINQFDEFGVSKKKLVPVITSSPQLLLKKPSDFREVVCFLEEMGFGREIMGRFLCRCPEIFAANAENTLRRKVKFLTEFGISEDKIPRVIRKYTELLSLDINVVLLPRMEYLMSIGLSRKEVCSMIYRFSPLLGYSIENVMKPKLEFLLKTMRRQLKEIVEYPRYFSYSLDKKIKPRFYVIKSRNIECSLEEMFSKNDDEFAQVYMGIDRLFVVTSPLVTTD